MRFLFFLFLSGFILFSACDYPEDNGGDRTPGSPDGTPQTESGCPSDQIPGINEQGLPVCKEKSSPTQKCDGQEGAAHSNGRGFVASSASVDRSVYVASSAQVCDFAIVKGTVKITGRSKVYDSADIDGDYIQISNEAEVFGSAILRDNVTISGQAQVYDSVEINGIAAITENAQVYGSAKISGKISGRAKVYGYAIISKHAKISGEEVEIYDQAQILRHSTVKGNAKVYGNAVVDNADVFGNAEIYDNARLEIDSEVGGDVKICNNNVVPSGEKLTQDSDSKCTSTTI